MNNITVICCYLLAADKERNIYIYRQYNNASDDFKTSL